MQVFGCLFYHKYELVLSVRRSTMQDCFDLWAVKKKTQSTPYHHFLKHNWLKMQQKAARATFWTRVKLKSRSFAV